jgi:hypothetical protein
MPGSVDAAILMYMKITSDSGTTLPDLLGAAHPSHSGEGNLYNNI